MDHYYDMLEKKKQEMKMVNPARQRNGSSSHGKDRDDDDYAISLDEQSNGNDDHELTHFDNDDEEIIVSIEDDDGDSFQMDGQDLLDDTLEMEIPQFDVDA